MTVFTFDRAQEILAAQAKRNLDKKKLANNTYLLQKEDEFLIRLHNTDIVKITQEAGQSFFTVNTDGWMTSTTKERINSFTPLRIFQKRGVWYVPQQKEGREEVVQFFDGMTVDQSGRVVNSAEASLDDIEKNRKLDKMICDYIKAFADQSIAEGLPKPDSGDCLLCKIYSQASKEKRGVDDLQHVYSHLEELYVHGSFLIYVLYCEGYKDPGLIFWMIERNCKNGDTKFLKRVFRSFFKKAKRQLLQFVELQEGDN
jgi:hypothetical protein